jgi:hypothetical protein
MSTSLAPTINDLFICKHGAKFWAPVDGLLGQVGKPTVLDDRSLFIMIQISP